MAYDQGAGKTTQGIPPALFFFVRAQYPFPLFAYYTSEIKKRKLRPEAPPAAMLHPGAGPTRALKSCKHPTRGKTNVKNSIHHF
jgi:hypothetical protein